MQEDPYPSLNTPIPVALELPPEPPDVAGFEILSILGQGAMSVVYEARPLDGGAEVALKVLREEYASDEECVSRLEREVRIAACVQSPHVPKTFGLVQSSLGIPCIAMERLRGKSLAELLHERGTFSVEETLDCAFQVCAALGAAHPLGVVHRDLKPSNIFYAERDGRVTVKVMDFGLSKLEGDLELTGQFALFGTPKYMSPEQVASAKLADARSDLWSLGVILYRMLSGTFPFDGAGYASVLSAICMRDPIHLSDVMPSIDRLLGTVVMNLLKKDPSLRYQDVDELESALRTFARGETGREAVPELFEPGTSYGSTPPLTIGAASALDEDALRRMRPSRFRVPLVLLGIVLAVLGLVVGATRTSAAPAEAARPPPPPVEVALAAVSATANATATATATPATSVTAPAPQNVAKERAFFQRKPVHR